MIRFRDAVQLTRTKFKTRRVRTVFAAISLSIGSVIILSLVIFSGGVMHFAKDLFRDSLADRSFASEQFIRPTTQSTPEQYLEKYTAEGAKAIYVNRSIFEYGFTFSGEKFDTGQFNRSTMNLSAVDPVFIADALYEGHSFENTYDGKIPIIIPASFILDAEQGTEGFSLPNPENQYEAIQQYASSYIDHTFSLATIEYAGGRDEENILKTTDIEVIVVGISKITMFGGGGSYYPSDHFIIPNWAVDSQDSVKRFFKNSEKNIVYEFETKKQRDAFVKTRNALRETYITPVYGPFEMLQEAFKFFRRVAYSVGGFFLVVSALFLMTTLGKIIADSKQEIGVFRAVGAQKNDIRKIYLIYAWILSSLGYLIGLGLAYILAILASLKWGEKIFHFISIAGTSYDIPSPKFIFVSFPLQALIFFYFITLLIALFASLLPMRRAAKMDPVKVLREQ
ncbi:MAG: ABC transporter permease [Candidatus Kerfeldbacteria bacterium]|nr:ABC transporter permease [Candidatus Kerfeldbacteria bacterium]